MKIKIISLIFLVGSFLLLGKPAWATDPHLFLLPNSGNYSRNFSVEVRVDTGGQAVGAVDVYLDFSASLLKIESITKGTDFPEVNSIINNDDGKLWLISYFSLQQAGSSFSGSNGLIATVNFSLKQSGAAEVKFICTTGLKNESNIIEKTTNNDLIVCNSNVKGSYTVSATTGPIPTNTPTPTPTSGSGSGGSSNPTATPTTRPNTPNATVTPTPTSTIPTTGSIWQTFGFTGLGLLLLLTGLALAF